MKIRTRMVTEGSVNEQSEGWLRVEYFVYFKRSILILIKTFKTTLFTEASTLSMGGHSKMTEIQNQH